MSFGYGVGDIITVSKLAWKVLQNTRQACGQYDELTREVTSLHIVLNRVQVEANNPTSLLFGLPEREALELEHLVHSCGLILKVLDDVLEKYDTLGEAKASSTKLWQRVRFGNTEMQDLSQVRAQISGQAASIALFLQLMSLGSQGRVERLLTEQLGALQELQRAKNPDDRVSVANSERASSILTTYENDDKDFWKQFRRELIAEGCSSDVMSKHRELIVGYIRELETKGVFDIKDNRVSTTFPNSRESMVSTTVSGTFDPDDKATNQLIYTRIMASASIRSSIILPYLAKFPSVPLGTTSSTVDLQVIKDDTNLKPSFSSEESHEVRAGIQRLSGRDPSHPILENLDKTLQPLASASSRNNFISAHIPTYALLTGDGQASLKESFQHTQSNGGELEGRDKKSQPKLRDVQPSNISQPDALPKVSSRGWQPPVYTPYESTTLKFKSASLGLAAEVVSKPVPRPRIPVRPWQAPDYTTFDFTDGALKSSSTSTPITVSAPKPNPIIEHQGVQNVPSLTTPKFLPDVKPVISDGGATSPNPIRRFMREYKIVVMGSGGVDKSSLVIRLMQNETVMDRFNSQYYPIEEDSYRKQCVIDDEVVILDVLDTAGQEEYSAMREQYMRMGEAFMLVYSITSKQSLDSLQEFYTQILRIKDKDTFPMILVGNHLEKEDERQVSKEETQRVAKLFGCPHCEVSSLEGTNIELSFFKLVREARRWEAERERSWQQPSTIVTMELDATELESPLSRLKDFLRRRSKQ